MHFSLVSRSIRLLLKEKTHLPVIADPSHGIGLREHVPAIALAAVAAGADGLIYEVQDDPETAVSDARQTIDFTASSTLTKQVGTLLALLRQETI